jgi:DNA-binding MarR family transcriptional regulator
MVARTNQDDRPAVDLTDTVFRLYAEGRRMTQLVASRNGVTAPQLAAVALLGLHGPMSLSELGERMHTGPSTLTGIVDRMEREELAVRERSSEDRRVWRVGLTPRGGALASRVGTTPGDVVREALGTLTASERRELGRLLAKLSAAVDSAGKKAGLLGGDDGDD